MKTLIDKKTKSATLVLSEELTIARVSAIRDALQNVLEEADNLTVDVGVASEIDLSFLQLMCSAHRTGASRGKQVTLAGRGKHGASSSSCRNRLSAHGGLRLGCRQKLFMGG